MSEPRYSVGIDLGTSNCVIAYLDLLHPDSERAEVSVLTVPQLIEPGVIAGKPQLPSLMYLAHEAELAAADRVLPWDAHADHLVGEIARQLGTKTPLRLVASAKSWLCHAVVDCKAEILPAIAGSDVAKTSPFAATVAYLQHLHAAWNAAFPEQPLCDQLLTITVPASFDPAARDLTVEAAQAAGLSGAVLLEEPQAALYSWIQRSADEWRSLLRPGEVVLVVDVGGGTTDFSLIAASSDNGNLSLKRIAIGDHILLGGDNMDLALAYLLKAKLEAEGKRLESWQIQALTHACRDAKEALLDDPDLEEWVIVVPGRSSSLMGGSLRTLLTREEVSQTLVDGFFPNIAISEQPQLPPRGGLTTVGLPYARDARMTCHLGAFLSRQLDAAGNLDGFTLKAGAQFIQPAAVLLNGGVFRSQIFSDRLLAVINDWLQQDDAPAARVLPGADLDLAVACGAAYFGYVRQGKGIRIQGGTAAAYYVGVESAMPVVPGFPAPLEALCIAPFGMEEGSRVDLKQEAFGLVVGEPVKFRFFASTVRRDDQCGDRLDGWAVDTLHEQDPVEITLAADEAASGDIVPVFLAAAVTEVGTLQLEAVARDGSRSWKIEFQVQRNSQAINNDTILESVASLELGPEMKLAIDSITAIYGKKSKSINPLAVKTLRQDLEQCLGPRDTWDTSTCRVLFDALLELAGQRRRSEDHERVWFNLAGYCSRPGFGAPLDQARIAQTLPLWEKGLQFVNETRNWAEWWTFWRRLAGGLDASMQQQIFESLQPLLDPEQLRRGNQSALAGKRAPEHTLRLAAVLERIGLAQKQQLGTWICQRLEKTPDAADLWWALGRVAARQPLYASVLNVLPPAFVEEWLNLAQTQDWRKQTGIAFAATLMSRMTGDPVRDIPDACRTMVLARLRLVNASPAWIDLVTQVRALDASEEQRIFGEGLPSGLRLLID